MTTPLLEYKPLVAGKDYGRHGFLKVYAEEHRRWPREQAASITEGRLYILYGHLCNELDLPAPAVKFRACGRSVYFPRRKLIRLARTSAGAIPYGHAVHEFAHHLAQHRAKRHVGHTRRFWMALEKCYLIANEWMAAHPAPAAAPVPAKPAAPARPRVSTEDRIRAMEGIAEVEGGRGNWWAYSKAGWQFAGMGCHTAHEDTIGELLAMVKTLEPCDCDQCKEELKDSKGSAI